MISFACPSCHRKLSVQDGLAGKKVKCPGCVRVIQIPAPVAAPTLGGSGSAVGEMATLPPAADKAPTAPPPRQSDVTASSGAAGALGDAGLTDFLAPAQADDELGRLGGFRILKILGHGGMGVVFEGEDPKLGRKVALKAMLPHLAGSKSGQERFLREDRAAAALEHDHIVAIDHVGEDRARPGPVIMRRIRRGTASATSACAWPASPSAMTAPW